MKKTLQLLTLSVALASATHAQSFTENFDMVANLSSNGWHLVNMSTPAVGTTLNWFQGDSVAFPAYNGVGNAYIAANFNMVSGANTISAWLMTPVRTLRNGDTISFLTRTVNFPLYPDRLELRMSTNGSSTNVGTSSSSVGDFSTLMLSVNPSLTTVGYPNTWTQYSAVVSGLSAPTSGRFALRYFVTNSGPSGSNGEYIGVDSVSYRSSCVSTTSTQVDSACSSYTWATNDSTYTTSGTYTWTGTTAAGCDSIVTLDLTIKPSASHDTTITTCQFYDYNNNFIDTTGIYTFTYPSSNGCDSTFTINLTIEGYGQISNQHSIDSVGKYIYGTWYAIDDSCKMIGGIYSSDTATAKTFEQFVAPTAPTFNGQPYLRRYYDIRSAINTPSVVFLLITADDIADYNANNGSYPDIDSTLSNIKVTVFHSDINSGGTGPHGHDVNSAVLASSVIVNYSPSFNCYVVQLTVDSFSGFYIHTSNTPTPLAIALGDISAVNRGSEHILTWNSLKEAIGDTYLLERSKDGMNFSPLATISAKGNPSAYNFVDANPYQGTTYYRITMFNNDGTSHKSKIVSASLGTSFAINAYPNPTKKDITVSIIGTRSADAKIMVTDVSGLVLSTIDNITTNEVNISLEQYAQGIYFIKYIDGDRHETIKVNKN